MSDTPQLLLAHHLKALKLPTFLREYDKQARQCAAEGVDHVRYLVRLTELELIDRERRMVERRIRMAKFPAVKSLDSFDFKAMPSLNKMMVLELARCEYIERRENVIALGNSGTGKTHIALGLGLAACQKGLTVGFITAAALVHELIEARDEKRLLRFQKQLAKYKLLIIDELGFVPLSKTGAELLFEVFYHRAECLTHVGDSQAVRSLTQCGEPMRFAMAAPIDLRNDFDSVSLRRLAKRTRDATQSRRLLALAEVYDGGSRTDASRIGGVGLQIIRDWVLRFNARGLDGLVDGKSPGAPSKLNADHRRALAEVVEAGPVPAVDGVVRWRRKDLARWLLETFAISLDETTVGRELKALGFAKISARPRHYAQNELAVEAFKKNFPAELAKIRARLPKGVEIELWWQDEARIGQKNKLTRRWARRGTRPRAPRDQRTEWAYIFGAICPAKGKGAGLVMPWCDTDAMAAHLIEISAAVDPGAQAVLIVDQAGWHLTPKLAIPDNITVLALPPRSPELNPVENVWQFMRDNWLSNRIFKSYEDIVALCCQAWNNLIDQPWKIMSLGMRKWAHGF